MALHEARHMFWIEMDIGDGWLKGKYALDGAFLRVRNSLGDEKMAPIGSSKAAWLAKIMLIELDEERRRRRTPSEPPKRNG